MHVNFHGAGFGMHFHGQISGPSPWRSDGEVCVSILFGTRASASRCHAGQRPEGVAAGDRSMGRIAAGAAVRDAGRAWAEAGARGSAQLGRRQAARIVRGGDADRFGDGQAAGGSAGLCDRAAEGCVRSDIPIDAVRGAKPPQVRNFVIES